MDRVRRAHLLATMPAQFCVWCAVVVCSTASSQTLTPEICSSMPNQIDLTAADLPLGADYVALARQGDASESHPPRRADVGDYFWLATWLRLFAECHLRAIAPDANATTARQYLKAAAHLGDANASHELASILVFRPVSADERVIGAEMLQAEYEAGSAFAAGTLGWAYHMGYGVRQDDARAFELYEKAAEGGMTLWQFLLAHVYEQGYYGRAADPERARYWKEYPNKVHVYTYECAVLILYRDGWSFPRRPDIESLYADLCTQ